MVTSHGNSVSGTEDVFTKIDIDVTLKGRRINVTDGIQIDSYLSVPYAKPPIEELRFRRPEPLNYKEGELYDTTKRPNACMQDQGDPNEANPANKMWSPNTDVSEDCLYLTIWAPASRLSSPSKLPVMIWIYGGSFTSGSNALEVYNGSVLAASQNVIVVSMQYRLGVFGFLYTDMEEAPGNQGLWDQQTAIQWVSDRIHFFHGDSEKITLFGESAGAASVGFHLLSPYSENLFKNLILQSGSPLAEWSYDTKEEALQKTDFMSETLNCAKLSLNFNCAMKCLREMPAIKLWTESFEILKNYERKKRLSSLQGLASFPEDFNAARYLEMTQVPVIDGIFLPASPRERLREMASKARPSRKQRTIIAGTMKNEASYFLYSALNCSNTSTACLPKSDIDKFNLFAGKLMPLKWSKHPFLYLAGVQYGLQRKMSPKQYFLTLDALGGDVDFRCPTLEFAELLHCMGHKVFVYEFRRRTSELPFPPLLGTMHGYEIEYIFGQLMNKNFKWYGFSEEEKDLSKRVMQHWGNVANYDNPNGGCSSTWPTYTLAKREYIALDTPADRLLIEKNLRHPECLFWTKVLPEY